jgi:hypothetical protein
VLIDEDSRAIFGYSLALSRKPSQEDILACIEHALTPWQPLELTVPNLEYEEGDSFPSGIIPELAGALWNTTKFDNAWANLAFAVTDTLMDVVGSDVNAGTAGVMNDRSIIERFFRTHTENTGKRLLMTTGGHPKDPIKDDPEKQALKYHATLDHYRQLIDVAFARYNNTPHSSLGGRTPLQYLDYHYADPKRLIRRIGPEEHDLLDHLGIRVQRKVQGQLKKGDRPYVEYLGGRYRSEILADLPELIGSTVTLLIKPRKDIRYLRAFLASGKEVGTFSVGGPWRHSAHTLKQRKEALKLIREGLNVRDNKSDPIQAMKEMYAKQATRNKKAASKAAKLQEVQKENTTKVKSTKPERKPPATGPRKKIPSRPGIVR